MKKINSLLRTDSRSCPKKPSRIAKFCIFLTLFAVFGIFQIGQSATAADLQQRKITGTITGQNGEPLAGATVQVEGTTVGTLTDAVGKFSIDVPGENATISVSFIGYVAQRVPVAGKSTIDLVLEPTTENLQEVVVVGYGTQKRTSITGSVSVVKGDVVAKAPVANITSAMAGQLAGVLTRNNGGKPGSDNADIHIRGVATTGSGNPLVVVDGIPRSSSVYNYSTGRYDLISNINQIDPEDIESVSVLKDASAVAPYGMAGANGVILITTKKGTEGLPTLTLNMYYGVQKPTYYPDLLNAVDYMKLRNEATLNQNPAAVVPFLQTTIDNYASLHAGDPDKYPDSNTDDLINFVEPIQKYDLQMSGGTDKLKYFAGVGFFGQQGMFDKVYYNRFNYNLNLSANVTKTTTMSASFLGSLEKNHDLDVTSSAQQMFRSGYKFIPTEDIYYSNGLWGQFAGNSPVAVLKGSGYNVTDVNTVLTTLSVEQQIPYVKGLSVKGTFSFDSNLSYQKGWHTPFYYYTIDLTKTPRTFTQAISTQEGNVPAYTYLTQQDSRSRSYTYQGYITYNRTFGLNDISALVVAEKRANNYDYLYARRNNYSVTIDELSLGSSSPTDFDNGGSSSVGAQMGYVYRLGWVYNNRYMFEAAGRYDGHYYFAPGKRWGYFPSFSAGWRISQESFMKGLTWLDNLKIRASWGKSGNLAGSAYQYLSGYNLQGNGYAFGTGTMVQQAYVNTENNPNITWEVAQKADVGLEASLWKSLLTFEGDFFYEHRTGMLLSPNVTVPLEYGLNLAQQNAGIMDNYGVEITLGTKHEFQNGLRIDVNGNVSLAKNKMVQTYETSATYNNPNRRRTGRALGTVFGYRALGLFTTADDVNGDGKINAADGYNVTQWGDLHPGDIKYDDVSGPNGVPDGKIDSNDEVVIGYPQTYPLMIFGFNANATWKGFDLGLFFQGAGMMSIYIQNFQTYPFFNNNSNADYEYLNNRWTKDHQNAKYPIAFPAPYANNQQGSSWWQKDASYLRLKNAQLGYTLPKSVLNKLTIKSIRVYIAGQNLLTFSGLKFMDPESSYNNLDGTGYPNMKSYTVGANITF